jgi:hypothetical protein
LFFFFASSLSVDQRSVNSYLDIQGCEVALPLQNPKPGTQRSSFNAHESQQKPKTNKSRKRIYATKKANVRGKQTGSQLLRIAD